MPNGQYKSGKKGARVLRGGKDYPDRRKNNPGRPKAPLENIAKYAAPFYRDLVSTELIAFEVNSTPSTVQRALRQHMPDYEEVTILRKQLAARHARDKKREKSDKADSLVASS